MIVADTSDRGWLALGTCAETDATGYKEITYKTMGLHKIRLAALVTILSHADIAIRQRKWLAFSTLDTRTSTGFTTLQG